MHHAIFVKLYHNFSQQIGKRKGGVGRWDAIRGGSVTKTSCDETRGRKLVFNNNTAFRGGGRIQFAIITYNIANAALKGNKSITTEYYRRATYVVAR